ncbi:MAG: two-component system, NarL family, nitrate/nitrite response regulator NarL [Acidimicrobiaceae bacterium]
MTSANGHGPIRVVIADDESDVRLLLRIQLELEGFEIAGEANDGQSAIEQCRDAQPDVVVLDLLMPGVNGFEAIPTLRRHHPDVAIVAYTAVAGDYVRKEMSRLHIPLLLKSGDVTALAAKIRELVRSV